MTKRLLSWLLVLALLVGVCVTALADEPPIYDGGGCKHLYTKALEPRDVKYTIISSTQHYKTVTQLMKCEFCASTAVVQVESPKYEQHTWKYTSKELVGDRYKVTKECIHCHKVLKGYEN